MRGDFGLFGVIEQSRILAVNARDQLAGIADPELPARVERPGGRISDFFRPGWIEAAVAPYDGHGRTIALRRE